MAENQLQVLLKEQGLEKENATAIIEAFGGPFEEAGEILANYQEIRVTDESQTDLMRTARENRLALKKARNTVENNRKALKEDIVKQGRAIDSIARFVKETIQPAEEYLEQQEKFGEIKAAERQAKVLADRVSELSKYMNDPLGYYRLDDMDDEQFANALESAKSVYEAKQAEFKKIEDERIAKEKAEAQAKAASDEAERQALLAPDKDKLLTFSNALEVIRREKLPAVKTKQAQDVITLIDEMLTKMRNIIEQKAEEL